VSQLDTPDSSGYSSKPHMEILRGGYYPTWVSRGTLGIIIPSLERRGAGGGWTKWLPPMSSRVSPQERF